MPVWLGLAKHAASFNITTISSEPVGKMRTPSSACAIYTYVLAYTSCSQYCVTFWPLNDTVKPAQFVGTLERVRACLLNYHGFRLPLITQEKWPSSRTHAVTGLLGWLCCHALLPFYFCSPCFHLVLSLTWLNASFPLIILHHCQKQAPTPNHMPAHLQRPIRYAKAHPTETSNACKKSPRPSGYSGTDEQ